jgi:hypothetical protein
MVAPWSRPLARRRAHPRDVHVELGIRIREDRSKVTPAVFRGAAAPGDRRVLHRHQPDRVRRRPRRACRSSTRRSPTPARVAELVLAEIMRWRVSSAIAVREVHGGRWRKVSAGCHEVRGKTLGIVGYGHIGSRSACWPRRSACGSCSYDIASKLALGNVARCDSPGRAAGAVDFVTLHVPETPQTQGMIGAAELARCARALPAQRQPRHRGRYRGAGRGAAQRAPRGRGGRRLPRGARGQRRLPVTELRGSAQRHPDAAHRRLDRGGAGGIGREVADQRW